MKTFPILCGSLLAALPAMGDYYTNAHDAFMGEMNLEIKYAAGLQDLGVPGYANLVITRLEEKAKTIPPRPQTLHERGLAIYWGRALQLMPLVTKEPGGTNQLVRWHTRLNEADALVQEGRMKEANEVLARVVVEMETVVDRVREKVSVTRLAEESDAGAQQGRSGGGAP
jgi:hypothetical protein